MTPELTNAVYDVLVEEAGVDPSQKQAFREGDFRDGYPEWVSGWLVVQIHYRRDAEQTKFAYAWCGESCDLTPEREAIIKRTNEHLAKVMEEA